MHLVIIGAGPAGYTAAFEAAGRGIQVTLIENAQPGGTCLNCGCIPTKTIRASADALNMARRMAQYGIDGCDGARVNPPAVQKRKNDVIGILRNGLVKTALSLGVKIVHGKASISQPGRVRIDGADGEALLDYDDLLIATGSAELQLPGLQLDHQYIIGSADALDLEKIPKRLVIVGGGVIGCEMACIFRAFGSDVCIVEGQDRILPIPSVDTDTSAFMAREMRKRKIRMFTGATVKQATVENGVIKAILAPSPFVENPTQKDEEILEADRLLVTVGRSANSSDLGLEACGVKTDRRGWIEVDEYLRTAAPHIYAAGDILGPAHVMLAHVAAYEGLAVVDNITGANRAVSYDVVPSAIFTEPEIGCVGLTEQQAAAKFTNVVCGVSQMRELGKAQAMGELAGFFKIIANGDNGRILGMQIAGAHASDILAEATLALQNAINVDDLVHTIHAHPTLAEGVWEASRIVAAKLRK